MEAFAIDVVFPELKNLLEDEERNIIRLVTFGTADRMKAVIGEPKSGNPYKRGDKTHIASAPGEAPASDSSNLINTIMPNVEDLQGEITLAAYGLPLEFGTNRAGRNRNTTIAARPFIVPSLEEVLASL